MTDADLILRTKALLAEGPIDDQFAFRGAQFDAGLAQVQFPEGKGGLGLGRAQQLVVDQVLDDAGVPYQDLVVNPVGIGIGMPTVLAYGSEALQAEHLRRMFTGEDIWCQLFSEPSHGSDLAGIASRAVRDGNEWVVNGQKVWTSLGHISRYGLLVTRTNPDVEKYHGLSYFVLDMQTPGVDVRPLFQMTGEAEFNEVFLSDVRIPDTNMLGAEGDGWRVALTTLMNERVALGGGTTGRGRGPIRTLLNLWEQRRDHLDPDQRSVLADTVTSLWIRAEVLRQTDQRAKTLAHQGAAGPEGSVGKLLSAELSQAIFEACVNLQGADGLLHVPGYPMTRPDHAKAGPAITAQFLRSRANTIEGGTSEILRNILGERVLNLPGEPRVDKAIPWNQISG